MLDGVLLTQLKVIPAAGGDVMHAMKRGDSGDVGFGEVYFSTIERGAIKAWKRHRRMTLNLVVPVGEIRFVLFDDRPGSSTAGKFMEERLSLKRYARITIPPGLWMGFQGCAGGLNMLMNIADLPHDPAEMDRLDVHAIGFDWVAGS